VTLIRGGKWVWWGGIAALLAVSAWNHFGAPRSSQADPFTAIAVVQWPSLQNWRPPILRCAFGIGLCGVLE
jgi:hypothetical protein